MKNKVPKKNTPQTSFDLPPEIYSIWQDQLIFSHSKISPKKTQPDLNKEFQALDINKINRFLKLNTNQSADLWEAYAHRTKGNKVKLLQNPNKEGSAYLAGFHLPNAARFYASLERFSKIRPKLFANIFSDKWSKESDIIDVGCGTGAMSLVLAHQLKKSGIKSSIHLFDQHQRFLEIAKFGHNRLDHDSRINTWRCDIARICRDRKFLELINAPSKTPLHFVMGYCLNELEDKLFVIVEELSNCIAQSTRPVILHLTEPVNLGFAEKMMEVRNLLTQKDFKVLFPCPKTSTICPLSTRTTHKDYCYSEFHWNTPKFYASFSKELGLNRFQLQGASYLFSNRFAPAIDTDTQYSVVVGLPRNHHEAKLLLCDGSVIRSKVLASDAPRPIRGSKEIL